MKLAVYAIAKNEAKHVARWAEATKGADVRLVLDTGSTDNTLDLLLQYGIEAHTGNFSHFRFDDARNMALDLITADVDVCVSLDMDEIPDSDFFDKLREAWKPDTTRAWVMWDTGNIWANNNRVHARHGYRWKYPCHEVITTDNPEKFITVETLVTHKPDDSKPRSSYLELLELGHKENPTDHRMIVYLAREYHFKQMWKELIEVGEKLVDIPGWNIERAQTWRGIGHAYYQLGDKDNARHWLERGIQEAPKDLEAWFPYAYFFYQEEMWQECYDTAMQVIELSEYEGDRHYIADSSMQWRMYDLLSLSCWNLGKKGSAKKYARIAMELNPSDERLKDNYDTIVKLTVKEYKDGLS